MRLITLTKTLIVLNITKPNLIVVLLYIERKKMVTTVGGSENLVLNVLKYANQQAAQMRTHANLT